MTAAFLSYQLFRRQISNTAATIQPNPFWFWEKYYFYEINEYGFLAGLGLERSLSLRRRDFSFIIRILPDSIASVISVIIVIITCIIQVISVWRSSQFPTSSNQRHVTITVLLMSTLFVLCNSVHSGYMVTYIATIIANNWDLNIVDMFFSLILGNNFQVITLLSATLFPMLNAALNPVIIITRSSGLRKSFLDFLQRMQRWVRERENWFYRQRTEV